MALTQSTMLPLGSQAPDFTLIDTVTQQPFTLSQQPSIPATVIMFICNHCPYVKHILTQLVAITQQYPPDRVRFIAISANDASQYPEDSPLNMAKLANTYQFNFPYLYDETQQVAKQYQAACTPDFYVFDNALALQYRGRFDEATPGNNLPITGQDLCQAIDAICQGQPVNTPQYPSLGCNIKWKI